MSAERINQIKKAEEKLSKHTRKAAKWRQRVFELLRVQMVEQQKKIPGLEALDR